uniref:Carbonic anhydrase n=1 Tax=Latimeria chalumnae TaxID=7897 RepID=M3XJ23_LATCH
MGNTLLFILVVSQVLLPGPTVAGKTVTQRQIGEDESGENKKSHEHNKDQNQWSMDYEDCGKTAQSPIDIMTGLSLSTALLSIKPEGYDLRDQEKKLTLLNNGHTVQLNLPDSMTIHDSFEQLYRAAQLHFHWGSKGEPGSEHMVDGKRFPAEIHVVHFADKYGSLKEAANKSDGLAVLGVFLEVGSRTNPFYEKLFSYLQAVSEEGDQHEIPPFDIRGLLPDHLERYFRYNGSLTTPPCFQSVTWTVFNNTIQISQDQLSQLENTLKMKHQQILSQNFRVPQSLHGRKVLASFNLSFKTRRMGDPGAEAQDELSSRGNTLAIIFGCLFGITLLAFIIYVMHHRKMNQRSKKETHSNVIYKAATSTEEA